MAADFVEWRKYLQPGQWKVVRDREELGANQEVSQFLQYNPRKIQEFQDKWTPPGRGQSEAGNRMA